MDTLLAAGLWNAGGAALLALAAALVGRVCRRPAVVHALWLLVLLKLLTPPLWPVQIDWPAPEMPPHAPIPNDWVQLLPVSQDEGRSWQEVQKVKPESSNGFLYTAPADGVYWFDIATIDTEGNVTPDSRMPRVPAVKLEVVTEGK